MTTKEEEKTVKDEPLEREQTTKEAAIISYSSQNTFVKRETTGTKFLRETNNVFQLTFDKHNFT
jgi:hypothetical protein